MSKLITPISVILTAIGCTFSAFGQTVDNLIFAIASGTKEYTISNFDQGQNSGCGNYTNGSTDSQLTAGGSLSCSVAYSDLGEFKLTVTDPKTGEKCTILSRQTSPGYIYRATGCSLPGVMIVNKDEHYKQYRYGDWFVNLQ